jgi:hypothetical protein
MKARTLGCAENVACMKEVSSARKKKIIKTDLKEVECEGVLWIQVTKGSLAMSCEHDNKPLSSI